MPDAGKTVDALESELANDPRFASMTAVKNKSYVVLPQADATIESPRLADGVTKLVDALVALPH